MKKIFVLAAIACSFALTSCSSSVESDAKKYNDLQVKYEKAMRNGELDEKLMKEFIEMGTKIEKKYNTPEKYDQFEEALIKVQRNN